ncbi:hypothetical protein D3C81_606430 [compost metagenome]
MTEQKGCYAHVGLPGLRELFSATNPKEEVKGKTYGLSNEEAINAIKANYPPESYTVLRESLDMAMDALQQLTEKDATIKELEQKRDYYKNDRNDFQLKYTKLSGENTSLRKALEETRISIGNAYEFGYLRETGEGDVQRMLDRINSALGEGDKE